MRFCITELQKLRRSDLIVLSMALEGEIHTVLKSVDKPYLLMLDRNIIQHILDGQVTIDAVIESLKGDKNDR